MQTREPSDEELERLARQYGFNFGDRELTANLACMPVPPAPSAGAAPEIRAVITRLFGESSAPLLRYGVIFGAELLENGELEERFDPAPLARLAFPFIWGGGAEYDATAGLSADERRHRLYAFVAPIQTRQVYWPASAGAEKVLGEGPDSKWDTRLKLGAKWRGEPWIPMNRRGR